MRASETQAAIDRAGGVNALAKKIGTSSAAVAMWTKIPPLRVAAVEDATGIPRHELRPDLYDAPTAPPPAPAEVPSSEQVPA